MFTPLVTPSPYLFFSLLCLTSFLTYVTAKVVISQLRNEELIISFPLGHQHVTAVKHLGHLSSQQEHSKDTV